MSLTQVVRRDCATTVTVGVAESSALVADAIVSALEAAGLRASSVPVDADLEDVDVVLADCRLAPDQLQRLAAGVALRPGCQMVLISAHNTRAIRQTMRQVGAATTFERTRSVDDLVRTLQGVVRGEIAPRDVDDDQDGPSSLTTRELQILGVIAGGATNEDVASRLGISPHTVRSHLGNILGKLGVSGRLGAVTAVRQAGLLPEPRQPIQ